METPRGVGVMTRAAGLLLRPGRAWDQVAQEVADPRAIFARYVAPLAAIPAVCGIAGPLIFGGYSIANVGVRESLLGLVLGEIVGYLLFLAAVYVLGLVISWVSPMFGGGGSRGDGIKVAAYAATAICVAGLAELYPSLAIPIGILAGLYSLYGLYMGLAKVMRAPEGRRLTAFALLLFAILALAIVRGAVVAKAKEFGGPLSASYARPPR
jgi:hypothetical protein